MEVSTMGDKHLSDVITVKDIMAIRNNKICIFSGVGSGKNWFVEHELIKEGNILYITSRRAKVNEILEEKIAQEYITWENETDDIVTTTNFGIEKLVKNEKFGRRLSEIITHFRFIVVDEAHSISTDAPFANSAFHVFTFLQYVEHRYQHIKIILMTGTPEPLQSIPNFINKFHIFDKMNECINLVPHKIRFLKKEQALEMIAQMVKMDDTEKTIYYSNSATGIVKGQKSLYRKLVAQGVKSAQIAISMGEKGISDNKIYLSELEDICKKTKESITTNNTISERVLLTTSTLKEGVNINDESIKYVFCESHLLSDIQQFAGRVRTTIDTLYIIINATQHDKKETVYKSYLLENLFSYKKIVPDANAFFEAKICHEDSIVYSKIGFEPGTLGLEHIFEGEYSIYSYGGEAVKLFIEYVENTNQYVKFNHLKREFSHFTNRFIEQKRVHKAISYKGWKDDLAHYCETYHIDYLPPASDEDIDIMEISEYLQSQVDRYLVDDEKNNFISYFANAFHLSSSRPQTQTMNRLLAESELPFIISDGITTRNNRNKRYIRIEKIDE